MTADQPRPFTGFDAPAGTLIIGWGEDTFPVLVPPDGDQRRWFGWFYGYPSCCVDAFVSETCSDVSHPVSGHRLCHACAAGPLAALRRRPAEHYRVLELDEDEQPASYGVGNAADERDTLARKTGTNPGASG